MRGVVLEDGGFLRSPDAGGARVRDGHAGDEQAVHGGLGKEFGFWDLAQNGARPAPRAFISCSRFHGAGSRPLRFEGSMEPVKPMAGFALRNDVAGELRARTIGSGQAGAGLAGPLELAPLAREASICLGVRIGVP